MSNSTGNNLRDELIRTDLTMARTRGAPLDFVSMRDRLEAGFPGFDFQPDEHAAFASEVQPIARTQPEPPPVIIEGTMVTTEAPDAAAIKSGVAAAAATPVESVTFTDPPAEREGLESFTSPADVTAVAATAATADPERARQEVVAATDELHSARAAVITATERERQAKGSLDVAVRTFVKGYRPSPAELIRQHINSEQAERVRRVQNGDVADGAPMPTPGPSAIDRSCTFARYGGSAAFTQKQMRTGHRRGAHPATARGARLPSSR